MEAGNPSSAQKKPSGWGHFTKRALWVRLQRLEADLRILRARRNELSKDGPDLEELEARLARAREYAEQSSQRPYRPVDELWALVHGIEADRLLLMPLDLLSSEALALEEQFRRKIEEPAAREVWLGQDKNSGPLYQTARRVKELAFQETLSPNQQQELRLARYELWTALHLVNRHAEKYSRQRSLNMQLRVMSGGLLLAAFFLSFCFNLPQALYETLTSQTSEAKIWPLNGILSIVLLGVAGAIVANLLSDNPVLSTHGPSNRPQLFGYYLFIKPALGAFAALLIFVLAQSQLLFSIESSENEPPRARPPDAQQTQSPQYRPPLQIQLGSQRALAYTYIVFFIAIGFSAEKFLGSTMDRVMSKLFVLSEQKEHSPGMPPTTPAPGASRPAFWRRAEA
jgi:uncharacterized membrane protein YeaQ/YmgE (transglycosylase-associated protein family)